MGTSDESGRRFSSPREKEAFEAYDRWYAFKTTSGHSEWASKLVEWDRQWRMVQGRVNKPWEHATEFNPPLTFSKVEDVHSVLYSFFQGLDFFGVSPVSLEGMAERVMKERAEKWTWLLRDSLVNESNAQSHLDSFIHDGCEFGSAFSHITWLHDVRKILREVYLPSEVVRQIRESGVKRSDVSAGDLVTLALAEKLVEAVPKKAVNGKHKVVFRDDDGYEHEGKAYVEWNHPFRPEEPVVLVERDHVVYDAPYLHLVRPEYMYVPPSASDLQSAKEFWMLDWMTCDEVAKRKRLNLFNTLSDGDMKAIREYAAKRGGYGSGEEEDIVDEARDDDLGKSVTGTRDGEVQVLWEYRFEDVDGDGYDESIVRCVADVGKKVLLCRHRLEYLFPHGRRPFADWHFLPVNHRYYGMGIPEIMEGLQSEENAFYWARGDAIEIISKPSGMYAPLSGLAPDTLRIMPGTLVRARNPRDAFYPFMFPTDPSHLWREQSGIEMQAERAIGSTDMGLGRGPTRPNAPRTLGGTALVVRQQQLRTDVILRRLLNGGMPSKGGGVRELLMQYMSLYSAYMPITKTVRTRTGDLEEIERGSLQGRFDFDIDLGEDVNNPQLRMQNAMVRYQNALGNPLIQQNPQSLWHITVDFLEATGMRDASKKLPPPSGEDRAPMDQADENMVMGRGVYIEPLMSDDHVAHLGEISQLMQDPQAMATIFDRPKEVQLLARHAEAHQRMMGIQAQMAAQGMGGPGGNGGGQQMVTAAQMGEQVSGPAEGSMDPGMMQ